MFFLRRLDLLPKLRAANNVKKSHEVDAKILSTLDNIYYHELREEGVGHRIMLQKFHNVQKVLKLAKRLDIDKEIINLLTRVEYRMAKTLTNKAEKTIPNYTMVVERPLLSNRRYYGRVALVEVLISIDFKRRFQRIKNYLGFYEKNEGRFSRRLRQAMEILSVAYYRKTWVHPKDTLKTIRNILAGGPV